MHASIMHLVMVLLGLFLIIAYSQIVKSIPDTTSAKSDLYRSLEGVYTIGVILLTIGVTLFATRSDTAMSTQAVSYIAMMLGIVITVLGGILVNKTSGTAKTWAILILVLGLLFIVATGYSIYSIHKGDISQLLGTHQRFNFDYGCSLSP